MSGALGDAIYRYTDGVTEAANKNDELFTEARLEAILRGTAGRPTSAIVNAVTDAVRSFAASAPQLDDITALVIRRVDL